MFYLCRRRKSKTYKPYVASKTAFQFDNPIYAAYKKSSEIQENDSPSVEDSFSQESVDFQEKHLANYGHANPLYDFTVQPPVVGAPHIAEQTV